MQKEKSNSELVSKEDELKDSITNETKIKRGLKRPVKHVVPDEEESNELDLIMKNKTKEDEETSKPKIRNELLGGLDVNFDFGDDDDDNNE